MDDVLDNIMDMDDDNFASDFSNEGFLDLAMLPPCENANALSDQDSDASDDMNEGVIYRLPRHVLNSACSTDALDKNCDPLTTQNPQQHSKKKKIKPNTRK